ncbi:MAG: hypothetical protein ABR552_04605 [Actinomycetota bacterium]
MTVIDERARDVPMHLRDRAPNYDRLPTIPGGPAAECDVGWDAIAARLRATGARVVVLDVYPGVRRGDVDALVRALDADDVVRAEDALLPRDEIERLVAPDVTDDPVFGFVTKLRLGDFFDPVKLAGLRARVRDARGRVVVHGIGASLVTGDGVIAFVDVSRWENTLRLRAGEYENLGTGNSETYAGRIYKRAWFVDWRVADRHKRALFGRMAFVVDACDSATPKMIPAGAMFRALRAAAARPFRVVPYFDPAPWGGQWM